MTPPPDLSKLTKAEKDALIPALWARVQALTARVAHLEARLSRPPETPGNSSLPPSRGHEANRPAGEGAARRAAPGQPGPGGRWPTPGRGARPARRRQGGGVRPLPDGAGRG